MQVTCASCHATRSSTHMTKVYVKGVGNFFDTYSPIDNVYVCATRQTCKNHRKAMRELDKAMEEWQNRNPAPRVDNDTSL